MPCGDTECVLTHTRNSYFFLVPCWIGNGAETKINETGDDDDHNDERRHVHPHNLEVHIWAFAKHKLNVIFKPTNCTRNQKSLLIRPMKCHKADLHGTILSHPTSFTTRKKLKDFNLKTLRQSWPTACHKRVVRRLHATKLYRVNWL